MQTNKVASNWSKSVELIEAIHISPTVKYKYVATSSDPVVNTTVAIMHELLYVRYTQLSFPSFDCDVYDANDIINCIARRLL